MTYTLSDLFGYASIGCWLGAQFPQLVENARRRSVEGLAWPFLLNWLLGDVTNLIGCILTHQLPFQRYLAIYFCFIDIGLVAQFIYYRKPKVSSLPLPPRSRTTSIAGTHRISTERPVPHYRALSSVAANVAAAAALVAQQEEQTRWQSHRQSIESHRSHTHQDEEDDEVDDETLARLADSFHSEGGRGTRGKKVSWSQERRPRAGSLGRAGRLTALSPVDNRRADTVPFTTSPVIGGSHDFDFVDRGRPRDRISAEGEEREWQESSAQRRSSRASRKGASMVFLGVWALFGVGTLMSTRRGLTANDVRVGKVLTEKSLQIPPVAVANDPQPPHAPELLFGGVSAPVPTSTNAPTSLEFVSEIPQLKIEQDSSPEYIIGRISAWICTTLYFTSRLPQIWKNFVRKSVDGLSMTLFICAFFGNFFYVSSILSSSRLRLPEPEASAYIRESIPYLIGSGGTLLFDVTIVSQSFIYKQKPSSRGRRSSRAADEEEGLLSAGATGAEDNTTPSRRRFPTASEGGE